MYIIYIYIFHWHYLINITVPIAAVIGRVCQIKLFYDTRHYISNFVIFIIKNTFFPAFVDLVIIVSVMRIHIVMYVYCHICMIYLHIIHVIIYQESVDQRTNTRLVNYQIFTSMEIKKQYSSLVFLNFHIELLRVKTSKSPCQKTVILLQLV